MPTYVVEVVEDSQAVLAALPVRLGSPAASEAPGVLAPPGSTGGQGWRWCGLGVEVELTLGLGPVLYAYM